MSGHQSASALGDWNVDRQLAEALAVEPSPEFLARVRMRIAAEPEPRAWMPQWIFAAAGAGALAVASAAVLTQLTQAPLPRDSNQPQPPSYVTAPLAAIAPFAMAMSAARRDRESDVEKPTPEMRAIMKSNADAATALTAHRQQHDYAAIVHDAATLNQNFAYVEAFWANKNMHAPIDISRNGLKAAADLKAAAAARDDAAIEKAMTALIGICAACHMTYRGQLPDKSYVIRLYS